MTEREESVVRTMLIAIGVALFCSTMVTAAVYLLRPIQSAYAAVERNRAIVTAAGTIEASASDEAVVNAYLDLEALVIDLETGEIVADLDGRSFDHWAQRPDETGARRLRVPVYLRREGGVVTRLVLPLDGKGMWSTIRGYLALDADLNTVRALVIHEHGETPGIGDRIQNPAWLQSWSGKALRGADGELLIAVSADASLERSHKVDVITGATITSQAVGRMVQDWLGADGYDAALRKLGGTWKKETSR